MAAEATLAAMSAELARLRAENERLRAASASSLPGGAAASSSLAVAIPDAASAAEVARLKAEVQELKAQLDSLRSIPRPLPMLTPGPADAASTFGGSAGLDPIYGAWGPPPRPQYGQMRIWVGSWNMVGRAVRRSGKHAGIFISEQLHSGAVYPPACSNPSCQPILATVAHHTTFHSPPH